MSWDEWYRKRFLPFFSSDFPTRFRDLDEWIKEMEAQMERMFREFEGRVPEKLVRERRLPEGGVIKEMGPFVYGFSVTFGPDRKPVITEFGNMKPSGRAPWEPAFSLKEEREPLVDIIEGENDVRVVAELPGVEKEDIKLYATENTITIDVSGKERSYYKELELPVEVDPSNSKSNYKNGILEVILVKKKESKKPKGESIPIE
ncbi:MAG: Hsp20/alpha crystallin family protein [Candidatus Verstraetearchaeota archaeon]|nr:Hsp20/alpha crystallin family protein [Candidatus Verstraetearchaeota archaeon]